VKISAAASVLLKPLTSFQCGPASLSIFLAEKWTIKTLGRLSGMEGSRKNGAISQGHCFSEGRKLQRLKTVIT
jgi:hypothetical protein